MNDCDLIAKIIIVGDSGVGKTKILKAFIDGTFNEKSESTLGVEFQAKYLEYDGIRVRAQIWDTAGQERFKSVTSSYFKGAKGAFVVYDVTSQQSFENAGHWYEELKHAVTSDINIMLIGNKADLEELRIIPTDLAQQKAVQFGLAFMETSAKKMSNIERAFEEMIRSIIKNSAVELEKETLEFEYTDEKKVVLGKFSNKACCC